MKIISILGHPLTIITLFFLLLMSGKIFGQSFIVYLFLSLSHAAHYSLFAVLGVLSLCVSMYISAPHKDFWIKPALMIAGMILISLTVFLLFQNSRGPYFYIPFKQMVPVVPFVLFVITILCGLIHSVIQLAKLPLQDNGWIKIN